MSKWRFEDVNQIGDELVWEFEINPEEGGQPTISHNVSARPHVGPWPGTTVQQGRQVTPRMAFSGKVLTQEQYEAFERWYMRRILLDMVDDLGRRFRGVLVRWEPTRVYKPFDPWYHEYQAEFAIWAGTNASGVDIYGHMTPSDVPFEPIEDDPLPLDDPLPPPQDFMGQYFNDFTELDLSWSAVLGAVVYAIEIDGAVAEPGVIGTSFTVDGPNVAEQSFRVAGVDEHGGIGIWSETFSLAPFDDVADHLEIHLVENVNIAVIVESTDMLNVSLNESTDLIEVREGDSILDYAEHLANGGA